MKIEFQSSFLKSYKKRIFPSPKLCEQFKARLELFKQNPQHPLLKDHALKGKMEDFRAFSISGDIRAIYSLINKETALFINIGSHNQVY